MIGRWWSTNTCRSARITSLPGANATFADKDGSGVDVSDLFLKLFLPGEARAELNLVEPWTEPHPP